MIVLIGGEKGGTGKTTLATSLAATRRNNGHDVLLIDTDKQGSASNWCATRDTQEETYRISCIQKFGNGVHKDILDLSQRYEDIIIDAGGRDSVELRSSLVVADVLYIPIQASQFDVWTLSQMNTLVSQAQAMNDKIQAFVIINRASPNPSVTEADDLVGILSDFEYLFYAGIIIRDRIAYRKGASLGFSAMELIPTDPKASAEIQSLYNHVYHAENQ